MESTQTEVEANKFGKFTPEADRDIKDAARRYNLDPRFLRAIIALESSGDWELNNRVVSLSRGDALPYIGMFDSAIRRHGLTVSSIKGDRRAQTFILARELSDMMYGVFSDYKTYSCEQTANTWYSGMPRRTEYGDRVVHFMESMRDF